MLSKAEETGPVDGQGIVTRNIPMLYVRGDMIIGISPLKKK